MLKKNCTCRAASQKLPDFKENPDKEYFSFTWSGAFDMAFMEWGQYNVKWTKIHSFPEETALASVVGNS